MWIFINSSKITVSIQFQSQKNIAVLPCRTTLPYPSVTLEKTGFCTLSSKTARAHYIKVKWQFDQPLRVLAGAENRLEKYSILAIRHT
jgi:hypothetical protein